MNGQDACRAGEPQHALVEAEAHANATVEQMGEGSTAPEEAVTPDEDLELVELCRQGSARGFRGIYEKYGHRIYSFARRFLGDEQHAEDVTQDVFLQVFRKLDGFRGDSKFSTWLFRVTVNGCKNKRRSVERDRRFDPVTFFERTRAGEAAPPPERELGHRELRDEIERALNHLTDEQRSLLLLKGIKNLSYEEIGEVLGQSENQIRGKLYRARKVFRDALAVRRKREGLSDNDLEAEVMAELGE
jgi:RNA polymerase sigma-70 factor (ECF subfamily)